MPNWIALLEDRIGGDVGHQFYVDGEAADDNGSGRVRDDPFQKIATAYAHCKTERNDVIHISRYEFGTAVETFPINLNKRKVHIIGSGPLTLHSQQHMVHINADGSEVFQLGEDSFGGSLINVAITSGLNTEPCIQLIGGYCWFLLDTIAFADVVHPCQDAILADAAPRDLAFTMIRNCLFGRYIERDGIRAEGSGNLTRSIILQNIFRMRNATGVCINHSNPSPAGEGGAIIGNRFYKSSLGIGQAAGWAITLGGATTGPYGYIIDDNHAMESDVAPQNNPYKDGSGGGVAGAGMNGWGVNWSGGVTVMPDVS